MSSTKFTSDYAGMLCIALDISVTANQSYSDWSGSATFSVLLTNNKWFISTGEPCGGKCGMWNFWIWLHMKKFNLCDQTGCECANNKLTKIRVKKLWFKPKITNSHSYFSITDGIKLSNRFFTILDTWSWIVSRGIPIMTFRACV